MPRRPRSRLTDNLIARFVVPIAALAAVAGCGSGTKTKTVASPGRTVTVTTTDSRTSSPEPQAPSASATPSTADAEQYARRTYVVQPQLGKRVFKVNGPRTTVTASDGSAISAFSVLLADTGDGTGQAVLLFRGTKFLGWASDRLAIRLTVGSAGNQIAVKYGDYQGNDAFCCPSSSKTVDYSWNGSRIVADGDPPLAFGKPGDRLRLSGD